MFTRVEGYKIIREGEDRILNDFIHEIKYIQNQLADTLKRMQKANIIEYFPVYKGFIEEDKKTMNKRITGILWA